MPPCRFFCLFFPAGRVSFPVPFKMVIRPGGGGSNSVHTQAHLNEFSGDRKGENAILFVFLNMMAETSGKQTDLQGLWGMFLVAPGYYSQLPPTNILPVSRYSPPEPPPPHLDQLSCPDSSQDKSPLPPSHPSCVLWLCVLSPPSFTHSDFRGLSSAHLFGGTGGENDLATESGPAHSLAWRAEGFGLIWVAVSKSSLHLGLNMPGSLRGWHEDP